MNGWKSILVKVGQKLEHLSLMLEWISANLDQRTINLHYEMCYGKQSVSQSEYYLDPALLKAARTEYGLNTIN
jgi:hypothetical protein